MPDVPPDLPDEVLKALRGRVLGVQALGDQFQVAVKVSRDDAAWLLGRMGEERPRFLGGET